MNSSLEVSLTESTIDPKIFYSMLLKLDIEDESPGGKSKSFRLKSDNVAHEPGYENEMASRTFVSFFGFAVVARRRFRNVDCYVRK
jgi:hypothetical protein